MTTEAAPAAVEIEPGVYEIRADGRVDLPARTEVPAMPTWWAMDGGTEQTWRASPGGAVRDVPALVAMVNTGAADCTVTILPAVDIPACPCMVHGNPGRQGAHAAKTQIAQMTVFAGWQDGSGRAARHRTPLKIETLPAGYPMIAYVEGFRAGEPDEPPAIPDNTLPPHSSPYGFDAGQPLTASEARTVSQRPVTVRTALSPRPAQAQPMPSGDGQPPRASVPTAVGGLFPGFVLHCRDCGSAHVSQDNRNGRVYHECEDCGNIRLFAAKMGEPPVPGFRVSCEACGGTEILVEIQERGPLWECAGCGNIRRMKVG